MRTESVLFIGDNSRWSELAAAHLENAYDDVTAILWDYGAPAPRDVDAWSGDRIFCFKADLVLRPQTLARAALSAINFHPAPPEYRGIGGYDYAVDAKETSFGVTCHHMVAKIDAGPIISVERFPVSPGETVSGLKDRAAAHCLLSFYNIVHRIRLGLDLPVSTETWGPTLYTRAMLRDFYRTKSIAAG